MTELIGTLGPACAQAQVLADMLQEGMSGIRLNLSHGTLEARRDWLCQLQEAEKRSGIKPALILDMQGPELRIGALPEPLLLQKGERVLLVTEESLALDGPAEEVACIPVPARLRGVIRCGQELLLDDGKIALIREPGEEEGLCRVQRGGVLKSHKSLALPGVTLSLPALTEQDIQNLREAAPYGIAGILQPFVRGAEDLQQLRCRLDELGMVDTEIYAKVENQEGMEKLEEFLPYADAIVIARGDLGNAMPLWILPAAQREIAEICRRRGKPYWVATDILASMQREPLPSRAELSDLFTLVLEGASGLIVTGETAEGSYPVEVISYLKKTALAAEQYAQIKAGT